MKLKDQDIFETATTPAPASPEKVAAVLIALTVTLVTVCAGLKLVPRIGNEYGDNIAEIVEISGFVLLSFLWMFTPIDVSTEEPAIAEDDDF